MRNFSCLLIGPPGSGKSTAASTAPGPVLFLDMDQKVGKMLNIKSKVDKAEVLIWTPEERLFTGSLASIIQQGTNPQAKFAQQRAMGYIKLAEAIDKLEAAKGIWNGVKVGTVVLDTFTSTEEHLKRLLMSVNGVATITQPLWGTILNNNENLVSAMLSLNKYMNVIVIAHQQAIKDELTGSISYAPLIGGSMKDKIGKDFEEVYFLEKRVSGDKAVYEMLTIGSSMKECRTTRDLPARVEPNFSKIYKE